uniref:XK-related protein n=1 Tax=Steinernema glaseri TaxID=37863 RepID=A0A1I8A0L4_9BILA
MCFVDNRKLWLAAFLSFVYDVFLLSCAIVVVIFWSSEEIGGALTVSMYLNLAIFSLGFIVHLFLFVALWKETTWRRGFYVIIPYFAFEGYTMANSIFMLIVGFFNLENSANIMVVCVGVVGIITSSLAVTVFTPYYRMRRQECCGGVATRQCGYPGQRHYPSAPPNAC